jgi:hypothetical protein
MLSDRIAGAFTFKREVFAEVENDPSFTSTAWLIVIVVGFLNQLGSHAGQGATKWILGAVLGTVGVVIGFAVAAMVISIVGKSVFNAQVTFDELVRTLGLAYVWNVIGFIGVLAGFSSALSCLLWPVLFHGRDWLDRIAGRPCHHRGDPGIDRCCCSRDWRPALTLTISI